MIRRVAETFRRAGVTQIGLFCLLTIAFALTGAGLLCARNIETTLKTWGDVAQVVVFLRPEASEADGRFLRSRLQSLPSVHSVRVISPAQARERLLATLGNDSSLLEGVESKFFPTSIEVRFSSEAWQMARVATLARRLEEHPAVDRIDYQGEWVDRIDRIKDVFVGGASLAATAGLAMGLALIFGASRLQLMDRRRDIEIMMLCGATPSFVRIPWLIAGAAQGLLTSAVAMGILWITFSEAAPPISRALEFVSTRPLHFFSLSECAVGLGAASLLTALSTSFALESHLTCSPR